MTETPAEAPRRNDTLDFIRTIALGLVVALAFRVLVFQPFTIPSASMEPNLLIGDYVIVTKFDYGFSRHSIPFSPPLFKGRLLEHRAARGDVVVFRKPDGSNEDVIKRVIGLPGDRVQVIGGVVQVNGRPIARVAAGTRADPEVPTLQVPVFVETQGARRYDTFDAGPGRPGDDTGVYQVPAGTYFVMGDNRDDSADSRWPIGQGMGYVPAETLIGKARFVLASWKPGASLFKPWTWLNLRSGRFVRPLP